MRLSIIIFIIVIVLLGIFLLEKKQNVESRLNEIKGLQIRMKKTSEDISKYEEIAKTSEQNISFAFSHSRRIPNHLVNIFLIKSNKQTSVRTFSEPMSYDKKWEHTYLDTSFTISNHQFDQLVQKIMKLENINFESAKVEGKDGTNTSIKLKTGSKKYTYGFWSPEYDTYKRGLEDYLNLCKELITIGGLNPKEILELED